VTGLSLDLTSYSATVGGSFYINPVVAPSDATNKAVTWKSSATNIETADGNGYVECIDEGSAVITCSTVEGGFTATCAVSVAAAESGGDDSGESGGGTTGGKVQFSTLEKTNGFLKADGSVATLGSTYHVSFPYTEGLFVSTATNGNWNITTYPPVLVLDNGTYTAPDLTKADHTTDVGGKLTTQYSGTLAGFSENAVVYASFLTGTLEASIPTGAMGMDEADVFYYIPGGEA
jgi:alpha-amylase